MNKSVRYLASMIKQTRRNLRHTWGTQIMVLFTVSLSVLIFSFFVLVSTNMLAAGKRLHDDIRLTVFFDNELSPALQKQLIRKIRSYADVENITYVPKSRAWERLADQLGDQRDVLEDLGPDFLPAALEVVPRADLNTLGRLRDFAEYLATLPGATKIQYGEQWLARFASFGRLLRVVTGLSAILLVLTTTFMIAYTIRLTIFSRRNELEILSLLGASAAYIRVPLLLEGILHGVLGSGLGLVLLYTLYNWILSHFGGQGSLLNINLHFFSLNQQLLIFAASTGLCLGGSLVSIRKFIRI